MGMESKGALKLEPTETGTTRKVRHVYTPLFKVIPKDKAKQGAVSASRSSMLLYSGGGAGREGS